MIKVENLSYGIAEKEILVEVSFEIENGNHCALIGPNGAGKSTLADMLVNPENYLFEGSIVKDEKFIAGFASEFTAKEKDEKITCFEFLSRNFLKIEREIEETCAKMAEEENLDELLLKYQELLDAGEAVDIENYESNISKSLYLAGLTHLRDIPVSDISGGEYKIIKIMEKMLVTPDFLILDEPDVFLDFKNLGSLCKMINDFKGTLLVITHNRFLLNHCFNKILSLENGILEEFDGTYNEYRCKSLRKTLELKKQHIEEEEEILRTQEMVDILRKRATILVNPVIGRSVNAKQSQLDRLIDRHIEEPFIELREERFSFPYVDETCENEEKEILSVENYETLYDDAILKNVSFKLMRGEKAVISGANGTGKTSLIKDIIENRHPCIHIDENATCAFLSQIFYEKGREDKTIYEIMLDKNFGNEEKMREYLAMFYLDKTDIRKPLKKLSAGEQNMFQIAMIANSNADFLILDEPTSHLDLFSQIALEKAIREYKGSVLMVSHDFYLINSIADYILFIDSKNIRRMNLRKFRKMVYDKYFDSQYLETDRKKQEIEKEINDAYKENNLLYIEKLCDKLEKM